jgi:hypothetical protein
MALFTKNIISKKKINILLSLSFLVSSFLVSSFLVSSLIFNKNLFSNGMPIFNKYNSDDCNNLTNIIKTDVIIIDFIIESEPNITETYFVNYKYTNETDIKSIIRKSIANGSIKHSLDEYTNIYHGFIVIKYKTLSHCIFNCKINIISNNDQLNVINFINKYYPINKNFVLYCNNKGCDYNSNFNYNIMISKNDEL